MNQKTVGNIVYIAWLLLPVIAFIVFTLMRTSRPERLKGTVAMIVFALPAYLGLICVFTGIGWPPDIFFRKNSALASVTMPGYKVAYAQQWGLDFYETYYEVTRDDGLKAYMEIDGDDNKCWELITLRAGSKVYFLCDEKTITEQTSYVDIEQKLLYAGWARCSRSLDDLSFQKYESNPLVSRPESGDPELYCR